jgi:cytochrome c biogenesis protein CcdA
VSLLDLNAPPPNHKFNVTVEREETTAERNVRLFKDVALFVAGLGFVIVVAWLCLSTLASTTVAAEEKKWAMSILTAMTGGMIGYLVRK